MTNTHLCMITCYVDRFFSEAWDYPQHFDCVEMFKHVQTKCSKKCSSMFKPNVQTCLNVFNQMFKMLKHVQTKCLRCSNQMVKIVKLGGVCSNQMFKMFKHFSTAPVDHLPNMSNICQTHVNTCQANGNLWIPTLLLLLPNIEH